ncbi:MAG: beta-lactamase family protein [Candidatus Dadabacteria bacterium]|nr:beta-lactamase family protein [Candidatus Dadabacteria bacterium]
MCAIIPISLCTAELAGSQEPLLEETKIFTKWEPIEFEDFLDLFFTQEMSKLGIPGAVFVIVKDGEVWIAKGWGFSDVDNQILTDPYVTMFKIGPTSKLFTATAIMQLAEKGVIDLNYDVNKYVSSFKIKPHYKNPLTVLNLLTHTGGFRSKFLGTASKKRSEVQYLERYLSFQMPEVAYQPGYTINYSDHGYGLLGYIVEEATDLNFTDYVEHNIFKPLGMGRSMFNPGLDLSKDFALGYNYKNGDFLPISRDFSNLEPAVGLFSTAGDISRFMIAFLQGGSLGEAEILTKRSVLKMQGRQYSFHSAMPGVGIGLIEHNINGQRAIWSKGGIPGYYSQIFMLPDRNLGFFVAYNKFDPRLAERLSSRLLDKYYPKNGSAPSDIQTPQSEGDLSMYEGSYRMELYYGDGSEKFGNFFNQFKVKLNNYGALVLNYPLGNNETLLLVQTKSHIFKAASQSKFVGFNIDEGGRVTHMLFETSSLRKISWYETNAFQLSLLALIMLVFLYAIFEWPYDHFARRLLTHRPPPSASKRIARVTAWLMCALNIIFLAGFALVLYSVPVHEYRYGVPGAMNFLLNIPKLTALLTILVILFARKAWSAGYWETFGRVHYTMVTVAALAFYWMLWYWNLLRF